VTHAAAVQPAPVVRGLTPRGSRARRSVALVTCALGLAFVLLGSEALVALGRLQNWLDHGRASAPYCSFRARTGLPCVGCGGTRALALMARGRWVAAWRTNALGAFTGLSAWLLALAGLVAAVSGRSRALRLWLYVVPPLGVLVFVASWLLWWRALPVGSL
jgi:hypothetical protein